MKTGKPNSGKRTLSAIAFTDAVGFSALADRDEETALRLLRRDTELIRKVSASFEGKVLKSTGDGLMILFESAVQAVQCAIQIQSELAALRDEFSTDQALMHRIGIHLGDVLITDDDVMGDGVNVAARLEQAAQPGGICISQTVYDVVKKRVVPLNVVPLGAQQLKNISEPVVLYEISSDGTPLPRGGAQGADLSPTAKGRGRRRFARTGLILLAALLLMMIAGRAARRQKNQDLDPDRPAPASNAQPAVVAGEKQEGPGTVKKQAPSAGAKREENKPAGTFRNAPPQGPTQPDLRDARERFMSAYDFEGFRRWILDRPEIADTERGKRYTERLSRLNDLKNWFMVKMSGKTESSPLSIKGPRAQGVAWMDEPGQVTFRVNGVTVTRPVSELEPKELYGLTLFLLSESERKTEMLKVGRMAEVFRQEYGLPLPETLKQEAR